MAYLLLAMFSFIAAVGARDYPNAVPLSKVDMLTLREGRMTANRRVPAIPQLSCVGGSGCRHFAVDTMRCKNAGYDYDPNDVQWTCTASLPAEFKLGSTDVMCEGYSGPNDPNILKGSCGVEYRLLLTEVGEERYGSSWGGFGGSAKQYANDAMGKLGSKGGQSSVENAVDKLIMIAFFAIFAWIVYACIKSVFQSSTGRGPGTTRRNYGGGGGGGGGGGWGDDDDPPPPYSPQPPRPHYSKPKSTSSRTSGQRSSNSQQQQGWRPGFWSGAATGAAAGYFAGGRSNRSNASSSRGTGGGGWFGSGSNSNRWDSGSGGGAGPSSSSSSSGARYESTGFGSTTRR